MTGRIECGEQDNGEDESKRYSRHQSLVHSTKALDAPCPDEHADVGFDNGASVGLCLAICIESESFRVVICTESKENSLAPGLEGTRMIDDEWSVR